MTRRGARLVALLGIVVALTVLAALALPAYEAGRAINDRVLATSAAEDAAKDDPPPAADDAD